MLYDEHNKCEISEPCLIHLFCTAQSILNNFATGMQEVLNLLFFMYHIIVWFSNREYQYNFSNGFLTGLTV